MCFLGSLRIRFLDIIHDSFILRDFLNLLLDVVLDLHVLEREFVEHLVRLEESVALRNDSLEKKITALHKLLIFKRDGLVLANLLEFILIKDGLAYQLEDLLRVRYGLKQDTCSVDKIQCVLASRIL